MHAPTVVSQTQESTSRRLLAVTLVMACVVLTLSLAACGPRSTTSPQPSSRGTATPTSPQQLVETKCSMCHTLDRVWATSKSRGQWVTTLDRMRRNGLVVTDAEYSTILDHLSLTQGK